MGDFSSRREYEDYFMSDFLFGKEVEMFFYLNFYSVIGMRYSSHFLSISLILILILFLIKKLFLFFKNY